MNTPEPIRWGILSTANIAQGAFLPALRATGDGNAYMVASRDLSRAREFAAGNGVDLAVGSYESLIEDDRVQAVYNPLPNSLHAEWTAAALRAGKVVLCEKPLTPTAKETAALLDVARETGSLLWEAFVFPFHRQMRRLRELIEREALGEVRLVYSSFSFTLSNRGDIRFSPDLGGGGILDVGCYCVRLARLVFGTEAESAVAMGKWTPDGVDEDVQGAIEFPNGRRLVIACGIRGPDDNFSRVVGSDGELRLSNAFHPASGDHLDIVHGKQVETEDAYEGVPSFTSALAHIHAVLRGETAAFNLAVDDALGNAQALDMLRVAAERNRV